MKIIIDNKKTLYQKKNEIFVKTGEEILFKLEEMKEYILEIKVSFENIDICNGKLTPTCKCRNDLNNHIIEVVKDSKFTLTYSIHSISVSGYEHVRIKFNNKTKDFGPLVLKFLCSASHFRQGNRFRVEFSSLDEMYTKREIVPEFLVNITANPKRSFESDNTKDGRSAKVVKVQQYQLHSVIVLPAENKNHLLTWAKNKGLSCKILLDNFVTNEDF